MQLVGLQRYVSCGRMLPSGKHATPGGERVHTTSEQTEKIKHMRRSQQTEESLIMLTLAFAVQHRR